MNEKSTEKKPLPPLSKRLLRIILFFVYPAYILHSLAVAPIYTVCSSNVGISEGVTVALYYLMVLIDLSVFFVSFSVLIYGMCNMYLKNMKNTLILILASPFFKYLLKLLISPFIDGIPSADMLVSDLYSYGVSGALEVLQYAVVIGLTCGAARKYRESLILSQKSTAAPYPVIVPFKRLLSFKNPLQLGAFISAAVIVVGRVASLAISDINNRWKIVGINQYLTFFAPYVVETVIGVIGYFLMLYIFIQIYSKSSDQ